MYTYRGFFLVRLWSICFLRKRKRKTDEQQKSPEKKNVVTKVVCLKKKNGRGKNAPHNGRLLPENHYSAKFSCYVRSMHV